MKRLFILLSMTLASFSAFAQADLGEGNTQLNAGVGFSDWGVPVVVGLDFGVAKNITVGAEASYRSKTKNYMKSTAISIGGNANYHFNEVLQLPSPLDVYAGISLSYINWKHEWEGPYGMPHEDENKGKLGFNGQIGMRYFFNNKFGLNLEFGVGNVLSGGKIGITYKL